MSHQVKLCDLAFTDIDLLKQAIAKEGLTITERMSGYYSQWNKGQSYGRNQVVEFGINIGGSTPCGVVKNTKDGTYELVGDEWGVTYGGVHGLKQLASHISQRYRIAEVEKAAASSGWEIVNAPEIMLDYNSKETLELKLKKRNTISVGACY
jgi:hypothetical protein